ncbi:MAG: PAS domain-containing sensor histidine kinase [Parcubacteria group bacterium]
MRTTKPETQKNTDLGNDLLNVTINNLPIGVIIFVPSGRVSYANIQGANYLGYPSVRSLLAQKDLASMRKRLLETFVITDENGVLYTADKSPVVLAMAQKKPQEYTAHFVHKKTGKESWMIIRAKPVLDKKGELEMVVYSLTDITEQREYQAQLKHTLSYAHGILGTMREPLLVLDRNLRVKSANAAFYRMLPITQENTEGKLIFELKNKTWDKPQLREALNKFLAKKSSFHGLEIAFDFPAIGPKVLLFSGQRLLQDEKDEELILLAMEDITKYRFLQQRNDNFISTASHELKTPMTTIKVLVQILRKRFERSKDPVLVEYLARMNQQIEHLTKLAVDLLDVSRIRANKFTVEEKTFDFDSMVIEVVKSCQFLSPQHKLIIKGKTGAEVKGGRDSISRVFINLIVNAIKYSPDATKVIITLSPLKKRVRASVQDFGIGIAKIHHEKIFDRFFQVGNKEKKNFLGLGIGLYISKATINAHHGRMWVESEEGKGSTFFFTLPLGKGNNKKHS